MTYVVKSGQNIDFYNIKTAELDPKKNYLSGIHPHGVFANGAFSVYGCDALNWDKLFPGINRRYITLGVRNQLYFVAL